MKSIDETLRKGSFGRSNGSRTMGHVRGLGRLGGRCALHGAADCQACDPEIEDPDAEISPEEEAELLNWFNDGEDGGEIALVIEPKRER